MKRLWTRLKKQKRRFINKIDVKSIYILIFLFFLLVIFSNCSINKSITDYQEDQKIYNDIYERTVKKWEGITTLKGYFRITATQKNNKGSIQAFMIASLPNNLRLELMSPGGSTEVVLVLYDNIAKLYYPGENIFIYGNADRTNINKILGIDMTPEQIIPVLIGKGYTLAEKPDSIQKINDDLIVKYSNVEKSDLCFEVIIDIENNAVKAINSYSKSTSEIFSEVVYDNFIYGKDYIYPRLMKITFPGKSTIFQIKSSNTSYSLKEEDEKIFDIIPKKDVKVYRLEDINISGTILFGKEK
jgi:outer membrane lipoprotein-sorting protein